MSSTTDTCQWQHAEECNGLLHCAAWTHDHGCFADFGRCDMPDEHPSATLSTPTTGRT